MKTKKQKAEVIENLSKRMPKSDMIIFTSFSQEGEKGLSVAKMRELKKGLKKIGAEYVVAKKNLIRLSVESVHFEKLMDVNSLTGSVGLVFGSKEGHGVAVPKHVYEFTKSNPVFRVLGAIFEKQYVDPGRLMALARLPSRDVLISRAVGMMRYPLTGLVSVLQGDIRNLLVLLSNIKKSTI